MNIDKWREAFKEAHLDGNVTLLGDAGQVTFTPEGEMILENGYERSLLAYDEDYAVFMRASFIMGYPTKLVLDIVDGVLLGDAIAKHSVRDFMLIRKVRFLINTFKFNFNYESPTHEPVQA